MERYAMLRSILEWDTMVQFTVLLIMTTEDIILLEETIMVVVLDLQDMVHTHLEQRNQILVFLEE